jgi:prevent-host-death family protein
MTRISVVKAKANFSRLLADVEAGREAVITRRGAAVAKISSVAATKIPLNLKSCSHQASRCGIGPSSSRRAILMV